MNEIETEFLKIHELQPFFWHFCIGNIFLIWIHGEEKLTQFLNELNNFHYGWKFIYEISSFTVNFLDLNVGLRNSAIHKDFCIKPSDGQQCSRYQSCHPYTFGPQYHIGLAGFPHQKKILKHIFLV